MLHPSRCTRRVAPAMLRPTFRTRHVMPLILRLACCAWHVMLSPPRCAALAAHVMSGQPRDARHVAPAMLRPSYVAPVKQRASRFACHVTPEMSLPRFNTNRENMALHPHQGNREQQPSRDSSQLKSTTHWRLSPRSHPSATGELVGGNLSIAPVILHLPRCARRAATGMLHFS